MIGDKVSAIAMRHYEPYSVRRSCERCHAIDYVARLLQPFRPALHVCRSCRQALTGVPDTRNMRTPIPGAARVAVEFAELAPPPVVIRGLLMPGPTDHETIPAVRETIRPDRETIEDIFAPWTDADDEK